MGWAFLKRWHQGSVIDPSNSIVIEADPARCSIIENELGIKAGLHWKELADVEIIFLAVKPQDFSYVAAQMVPHLHSESVIVSIMAGTPVKRISSELLGQKNIIRAMPNLPITVGQGLICYFVDSAINSEVLSEIESLLSACGSILRLDLEDKLNPITALSGSGPAYVYYIIEAAREVASEFGFNEDEADLIVNSTILGALEVLQQHTISPMELRQQVTSKGGTTEAAIKYFDAQSLNETFKEGVRKACLRAKELASAS